MRQKVAVGRNERLLFSVKTGSAAAGEGEEEDDAGVEARSCAVWSEIRGGARGCLLELV